MVAIVSRARSERANARENDRIVAAMRRMAPGNPSLTRVRALRELSEIGAVDNYSPFLPLTFQLNRKPYDLARYKQFGPMFDRRQPNRQVWITARQVAKSTSTSAASILASVNRDCTTTLFVAPRYEQIRRLSGNVVRPFIEFSPFRNVWTSTSTEKSVLQKTFTNTSKLIFSFALLDADRVRGVSGDWIRYDEIQDMNPDHIPVIREVITASTLAIETFTGTPKTPENTISQLHRASSQAEWFIPCLACNKVNIPSLEYDLERMIGPYTEEIGPERPGIVCAKCGRPVFPTMGRWGHRYASRAELFAGYHISQPIMALHYADHRKWRTLLEKRDSNTVAPYIFINEVLGEAAGVGNQLISLEQLTAAATLPWDNNPRMPDPEIIRRILSHHYRAVAMGIDWGGGGKEGVSYTTLALLGYHEDGTIDTLWGKRLLTPNDHIKEAHEVMHWARYFNVRIIAHDYTGAGALRETILLHEGFPADWCIPFRYVGAAAHSLVTFVPPTLDHQRAHYNLDRNRAIIATLAAIRMGRTRFFRDDHRDGGEAGLLRQFLSLQDEKVESFRAGEVYLIRRAEGQSDDFVHAVTMGSAALYHIHQSWPNMSQIAKKVPDLGKGLAPLTQEQLHAFGHGGYGWEQDRQFLDTLRRMPGSPGRRPPM